MSEEIRVLKEILNNNDLDNYTIDDDECYLNGYSRRCLKKVLEEIERLTELCNKYEEEHKTTFETWQKDIKENKQLHFIIKEVREYITKQVHRNQQFYEMDIENILEILDKVEKGNDIEFDVLKALNTDLDDDVEMG